jgi:hypothetical protein
MMRLDPEKIDVDRSFYFKGLGTVAGYAYINKSLGGKQEVG